MKRILVLRARDDAERTGAKLRAMGFEPLLAPVLEIVPTGAEVPAGPFDAVLATSAKGVTHFAHQALEAPLCVVGARTAQVARDLGWRIELVASDAKELLSLIRTRQKAPARFLYLAGRDRKADLERGLRAAGLETTVVETYAARAATALPQEVIEALAKGEIAAALHYSRRSAEIFVALAQKAGLSEALRKLHHLAFSQDVAAPLECGLARSVHIAEKPDEEHLLAALSARTHF